MNKTKEELVNDAYAEGNMLAIQINRAWEEEAAGLKEVTTEIAAHDAVRDAAIQSLIDGELCDVLEHYGLLLLDCRSKLGLRRAIAFLDEALAKCEDKHVTLLDPFLTTMRNIAEQEL